VDLSLDNPATTARKYLMLVILLQSAKVAEKSGMGVNKFGKMRDGVAWSKSTAT
jgi:hypothetical protein